MTTGDVLLFLFYHYHSHRYINEILTEEVEPLIHYYIFMKI